MEPSLVSADDTPDGGGGGKGRPSGVADALYYRRNGPEMDFESTRRVLEAFEREGVRYVVFGGAALNLLGLARFTEDLDLFIAPEVENIERVKRALRSVFDDPSIEEISATDLLGAYPAVQYVPPTGEFHLDLITRLGEAFAFADIKSARVAFGPLTVSVATPETLYRMKRGTVRLRDRADAELLRQRFHLEDEER
jgi:hypothetical protein